MKKIGILIFIMMLFSVVSNAACYVDNGNMENWTNNGASGPPDYWRNGAYLDTSERESGTVHGGTYSAKLTVTDSTRTAEFYQDLNDGNYGGNDYEIKAYVYDNDPAGKVRLSIWWYDNAAPANLLRKDVSSYSTDTAGWQLLNIGTVTAPANATQGFLEYEIEEDAGWDGDVVVYADDVYFCDATPLPVVLGNFFAKYNQDELSLTWTTYSEHGNSYWNVYRSETNSFNQSEKINLAPIEGEGNSNELHEYHYVDSANLEEGNTYYYWLESVDYSGNHELYDPISIEITNEDNPEAPEITEANVIKNYPNPFNPSTTIEFNIAQGEKVALDIYNVKGEKIIRLYNGISKGKNTIVWDGKDNNGKVVSSGVYFYQVVSGKKMYNKKMILLK